MLQKLLRIIFTLYICKNEHMVRYFDITDWEEKRHFQTKGTRDKCIVENPEDSCLYYFKTSIKKERKDYKYEFWSEIIASSIGGMLGFNILRYDIASKGEKIGCISKSMNNNSETLTEGVSLLTGYDNAYKPEDKESYKYYTLDMIENSLLSYKMEKHIDSLYKMLIFDSIIGNSDRHQENWGIISETSRMWIEELFLFLKRKRRFKRIIKKIMPRYSSQISKLIVSGFNKHRFSPIYDSGCCLAREMEDKSVTQILRDNVMFEAFINRARSEIRREDGSKYKHFELVEEIRRRNKTFVDAEIKRIISNFKEDSIKEIVNNIDVNVPESFNNLKLPQERKILIVKIVSLRIKKLGEMIV